MKLRWDARAVRDLRAIRSYIAAHGSPRSAERVRLYLLSRVSILLNRPYLGVATNIPDVRVLPSARYPYRIYYAIQGDDVVILHVRHTARQPPDDLAP